MDELEDIVQRMIDAGESEEDIKLVIENYENTSAETDTQDFPTAVATETAPVTADATAEDTDLALVDTSLESQSNAPFVINGHLQMKLQNSMKIRKT